jgi:hypothetical protein
MSASELTCQESARRRDVRTAPLYGFDYVDVSDDQLTLEVVFLGEAPPEIKTANVRITGGRRIPDIRAVDVRVIRQKDPTLDDTLEVDVDRRGDFSTYTFSLVKLDESGHPTDQLMDGFDPRYGTIDFSFKAGCPSDQDCKVEPVCPPPARAQPEIDYLAKDYQSFRQLILDRLAVVMPGWQEQHVPDIGIMLVEVLAYAADYLSYYQDAVATEAYLDTARQRISVRRHARLVDYAMHEGCNARAWITIATDSDVPLDPAQTYFCTAFPGSPAHHVLQPADIAAALPGSYLAFQPLVADVSRTIAIYAAHSEIHFYTWGDCACCLPKGATEATLTDRWILPPASGAPAAPPAQPTGGGGNVPPVPRTNSPQPRAAAAATPRPPRDPPAGTKRALNLAAGDVLIFEEVIGPKTGNPADAGPTHRQAVRLTKVIASVDPLYDPDQTGYGQPVVEIEWCSEDALTFPLCISAVMPAPDCTCRAGISVARGNVILVDNATPVGEPLGSVPTEETTATCATDCSPSEVVVMAGPFTPVLSQQPLTFSQPLPPCGCASQILVQDPRAALPRISLTATSTDAQGTRTATWSPKRDLMESASGDHDFVVEMDDQGFAHLRFGNGQEGRAAGAGSAFTANYSVGNGPDGNVGADTILYLAFRQTTGGVGNLLPRNPLPAVGGTAPEPVAEVKMFAPYAFRDVLERAITADDYAMLAADNARRLAARPTLASAAAEDPDALPGPSADDPRAALEEESGDPAFDVDLCAVPFQRLQGAKAALRWNGSWYEVQVAVDPLGSETAEEELLAEVAAYLEPYRLHRASIPARACGGRAARGVQRPDPSRRQARPLPSRQLELRRRDLCEPHRRGRARSAGRGRGHSHAPATLPAGHAGSGREPGSASRRRRAQALRLRGRAPG